jgi:hypothetical protein
MPIVSILSERGQVLTTVETDAHDPNRRVERMVQEIDPILEHVKRQVDARNGGRKHLDGLTLVGVIPEVLAARMIRDGSINDESAVRRFFNDPANKPFKVYWGSV